MSKCLSTRNHQIQEVNLEDKMTIPKVKVKKIIQNVVSTTDLQLGAANGDRSGCSPQPQRLPGRVRAWTSQARNAVVAFKNLVALFVSGLVLSVPSGLARAMLTSGLSAMG